MSLVSILKKPQTSMPFSGHFANNIAKTNMITYNYKKKIRFLHKNTIIMGLLSVSVLLKYIHCQEV